jgi:hypothetical protein
MRLDRNTCGDGRPRPSRGAKPGGWFAMLCQVGCTSVAILREIFDESAYMRFLAAHEMKSSREAYAAFWREHEIAEVRRPRCC